MFRHSTRLVTLGRRCISQLALTVPKRRLTRLAVPALIGGVSQFSSRRPFMDIGSRLLSAPIHRSVRLASGGAETVGADGIVHFLLADVGEGITECEVVKWYIKPGDKVQEFDKLCELQSDKATVEITSRYNGSIAKIYYDVGEKAKVGKPLVDVRLDSVPEAAETQSQPAAVSSSSPASQQAKQEKQEETKNQEYQDISSKSGKVNVLATPAVRMIARQNQIDLRQVRGSGRDGRVTKEDIQQFVSSKHAPEPAKLVAQPSAPQPTAKPAAPAATAPITHPHVERPVGADREVPLSRLQKVMTKTMTAAAQVPHFTYCDEIQVDRLVQLRAELKAFFEKQSVKLSYMPLILKATSLALQQFPVLNSHVNSDCTALTYKARHNIGIAMDTLEGLVVPVVKDIQDRSIFEIAVEINRLQQLGSAGKLSVADMTEGTFTLSNIGAIGGTYASPVLFLPQVAIGALGKFQSLPRFDSQGNVRAATIMQISWAADHRVIDGATIARFSNLWRDYLEDPSKMMVKLR